MRKSVLLILILLAAIACSANQPPALPKGKCIINEDCPEGKRCLEERCRDIYFPELDDLRRPL